MSLQRNRSQTKGPLARVGELLLDGYADCVEELGQFIIAYSRINQCFYALKKGTQQVASGKLAENFDREYQDVYNTLGADFERVSAEFLAGDWPKFRPDIWQANRDALRKAVSAFTERLVSLCAEYVPTGAPSGRT